jgi:hypothetical protein
MGIMRIDFDSQLFNLDGSHLKDITTGKERDALLKTVCVNALLGEDKEDSGEEKLRRYRLGTRIYKGGVIEVTAEEVSLMKKLIGRFFPPLVAGQSLEMLENPVVELKAVE